MPRTPPSNNPKMLMANATRKGQNATTISVVIPCFNCSGTIADSVCSLQGQTLPYGDLEIILVNDGSADDTLRVCQELAASDPRIVVVDKPNGGVGSARNAGIEAARGRYIAFLDSDDTLLPETLEAAVRFFDEHYDEIDLVTYPMRLYNEQREWPHVREQVLTETGVYDLTKLQNAFALITNVNVVVKNDDALPRFREDLLIHEDELFFMTVLLRKLKVGFSKCGAYRYQQLGGSAIATKMHPFYQFEKNIGFWEELFAAYPGKAPLYLQASFLNEVNWKIRKDVLFPYHYEGEDFERAVNRIRALMDRVDDDVIFTSPRSDEYYRHYLASLKTHASLSCSFFDGGFALQSGAQTLLCRRSVDAEIVRTRVVGNEMRITGILRSTLFEHAGSVALSLTIGGEEAVDIPLERTSHDYHVGHTRTNLFWRFEAPVPLDRGETATLALSVEGRNVPLRIRFSSRANFDTGNGIFSFDAGSCLVEVDPARQRFVIKPSPSAFARASHWLANTRSVVKRNKKLLPIRASLAARARRKRPTWLYYDRTGETKGNAYLQFLHDIEKNDGVDRFYVAKPSAEGIEGLFPPKQRKHIVDFASTEHRFLHLEADKILTSSGERSDWCPFAHKTMRALADVIHYELILLAQDIPLAHEPWKRSADRLLVDREVVSTPFEVRVLEKSYGFEESQLIRCGMPRHDLVDPAARPQRKILYALAGRKNLVTELPDRTFEPKPNAFFTSRFWTGVKELLEGTALREALEQCGYGLDIKLHRSFSVYREQFSVLESERVRLVDETTESDYAILVTDWSPCVFDFVRLKRAVAYFVPDEVELRAGLNGFHELDLPFSQGFGPFCETPDQLVEALEHLMRQNAQPETPFADHMEGFFFRYDNRQRERLYSALAEN